MSNNLYPFGPYAIMGKMVVCEVCGHKYIGSSCVMCEKTGDNGDWVDKVIKEEEQKKKDNDTSDT